MNSQYPVLPISPSIIAMAVISFICVLFFAWIATRGGKVAEIPDRSGEGLRFFVKGLVILIILMAIAVAFITVFQGIYPGQ